MNYICPNCGDYLVKRNGAYGVFYGCYSFPSCSGSMSIEQAAEKRKAISLVSKHQKKRKSTKGD